MTFNPLTWLLFVLLVTLPVAARAETDEVPPPPDRNPARVEALVAEKPVLPGDAPTVPWTEAEVTAAKADCTKILNGLALDYEPLAPIKEGICGAPAPILVKSIGSDPRVEIDPPATVTCALAAGLSAWLSKTVQPEATALLGLPVVKLHNATSYACRNRNGGETTPLSEHALANALDVSEFVFQSGERVTVLASWPHAVSLAAPANQTRVAEATTETSVSLPHAQANGAELTTKARDAKSNPFVVPTSVAKAAPPAPPAEATAPQDPPPAVDQKGQFVKTAHDQACNIFGTVLGPEANDAHKNHFHLDMKARRHSAFCE